MSLLDDAISDFASITGNSQDGVEITLTSPALDTVTFNGFRNRIRLQYNALGEQVNSQNATVAFSERNIGAYPLRDSSGRVNLRGHKVTTKDSTNTICTFIADEWYPDETLACIVVILGEWRE